MKKEKKIPLSEVPRKLAIEMRSPFWSFVTVQIQPPKDFQVFHSFVVVLRVSVCARAFVSACARACVCARARGCLNVYVIL